MSIRVVCPECDTTLNLAVELAGKRIRCKKCSNVVAVPLQEDEGRPGKSGSRSDGVRAGAPPRKTIDDEPRSRRARPEDDDDGRPVRKRQHDDDDDDADDDRPRRKDKSQSNGMKVGLLAGGGVAVVGILVAVLIIVLNRPSADTKVANVDLPEAKKAPPGGDIVLPGDRPLPTEPPKPPEKKFEPPVVPVGPAPAAIDPEMVRKVKRSTTFLRVTMSTGAVAEGSGFFAHQPGIVLTNAHVLGMLNADARRPKDVKVIMNSGEPDQRIFTGTILGVDRSSDLAVVRVPTDPGLPPPLPIGSARDLTELQKVYIFGFPFGSSLGKNISVSESSVSSIRKDDEGIIERIQVNGGMHPGNSGGPVVDARGAVVGVSVAGIRGTSINFAVPGDFVNTILDGRIHQFSLAPPYLEAGQLKAPLRIACIDPLARVKEARVEMWIGAAAGPRKASSEKPVPLPDDGPRQSVVFPLKDGEGAVEVTVPPLPPGRAYYFQPVVVNGAGVTRWAGCNAFVPPPLPPFERKPMDLRLRHSVEQRTVFLKSSTKIKIPEEKKSLTMAFNLNVDLSEKLRPAGADTIAQLAYLRARMGLVIDGKLTGKSAGVQRALNALTNVTQEVTTDPTGNPKRGPVKYAAIPPDLKEDVADLHDQVIEALEALTIPLPNRMVNPRETWNASRPVLLFADGRPEVAQMDIVYTYDGVRSMEGKEVARISFAGTLRGGKGREGAYGGKVEGIALFDTTAGYVSQAQADVTFDMDLKILDMKLPAIGTLHAEVKRVSGITLVKDTPPPGPGPGGIVTPLAKSKMFINTNATLTPADFPDTLGKGRVKVFSVKMKKGKEYQIDVISKDFDPMVRVETATTKVLAVDDDGGGDLNSRLIIRAPADGVYRVVVTSFGPNQFGFFTLQVREGL